MKKLSMTFFVVLGLLLSLSMVQAQVLGGGTGGWDEFKEDKSIFQLNLLTKKLFRNYSHNLSKCDDEIKPVKIKSWHEFSLSLIKQAVSDHQTTVNESVEEKPCPDKVPSANTPAQASLEKRGTNCALQKDEIETIKKLLEAKNFKQYLMSKHQMPQEEVDSLIQLLQNLIEQQKKGEESAQIGQ